MPHARRVRAAAQLGGTRRVTPERIAVALKCVRENVNAKLLREALGTSTTTISTPDVRRLADVLLAAGIPGDVMRANVGQDTWKNAPRAKSHLAAILRHFCGLDLNAQYRKGLFSFHAVAGPDDSAVLRAHLLPTLMGEPTVSNEEMDASLRVQHAHWARREPGGAGFDLVAYEAVAALEIALKQETDARLSPQTRLELLAEDAADDPATLEINTRAVCLAALVEAALERSYSGDFTGALELIQRATPIYYATGPIPDSQYITWARSRFVEVSMSLHAYTSQLDKLPKELRRNWRTMLEQSLRFLERDARWADPGRKELTVASIGAVVAATRGNDNEFESAISLGRSVQTATQDSTDFLVHQAGFAPSRETLLWGDALHPASWILGISSGACVVPFCIFLADGISSFEMFTNEVQLGVISLLAYACFKAASMLLKHKRDQGTSTANGQQEKDAA